MSTPDSRAAGERVAELFARVAPQLFDDLAGAGAVPVEPESRAQSRAEWECFALFGCVRGLVAARGFAPQTVDAIDALHARVFQDWDAGLAGDGAMRRALLARRYNEYETIAQAGGASGAHDADTRLGAAAARNLGGGAAPAPDLAGLLGSMHDALAEAVVAVLSGEAALPAPAGDTVPAGISAPPLAGARHVVERLERAGLACALGGSGLLAALSLTREVHDWDITTDASREAVEQALGGLEWEHTGSDDLHADEKFMLPVLQLEIIRGFSFFVLGGTVRIPTLVTRRWAGLPVGSPECWAAAYHLLGREAKRDALLGWLALNGAQRDALDALRAQRLPEALAALLGTLPVSGRSGSPDPPG